MAGVSKVTYSGRTLVDLTSDTVTSDKLFKGITAHGKNGESITGTFDLDAITNQLAEINSDLESTLGV